MNDAWLAGIIEGEGHIQLRKEHNGIGLRVGMVDKDVIETVKKVAGVGNITEIPPKGNRQKVYRWELYDMQDVREVLLRIEPYMHSRRRTKIAEALGRVEKCLNKLKGVHITPSGKYQALIGYKGKRYYLGTYSIPEEAKEAYEYKRKEFRNSEVV